MGWRERLRKAVEESGLRHSEVARRAGVSPESLSRILGGSQNRPGMETVMRIAHAVGENVGWLLAEGGFELSRVEREELDFALKVLKRTLGEVPVEKQPPLPNARPSDLAVPRMFAAQGARGVFVAIGDSMVLAGIADGDLLYVQPEADLKRARDKVVVCTVRGEYYVKRFHLAAGVVTLKSPTNGEAPLTIDATDPAFRLIGVVIAREGVFR